MVRYTGKILKVPDRNKFQPVHSLCKESVVVDSVSQCTLGSDSGYLYNEEFCKFAKDNGYNRNVKNITYKYHCKKFDL